ncbi:MAG: hypothetical protein H3C43_01420 [Leptonema sp. (in: Bacteria)]|nr:hypothetical protein [Leptonema sp. (in: bacteria)]
MSPTAKYKFLELVRDNDAILRGSQVGEKNHHTLYRTIRRLSTLDMIRSGQVYTLDTPIQEFAGSNMTRKSLSAILKNLIDDQLIAHLVYLRKGKDQPFEAVSCYIAVSPDEQVTSMQLYYEVVQKGAVNIQEIIENQPIVTKEEIRNDLNQDFSTKGALALEKLSKTIIDPIRSIVPGAFDFVPDADLLRYSRSDLKDEIVRKELFVDLFEYGLMPLRKDEVLLRFEAATDFLMNRLLPAYRDKTNLKAELEAIYVEESAYYLDTFAPRNSEFTIRKAAALKKNLIGQSHGERVRFPGLLTVEQILQLASFIEPLYKDMDQSEVQESLNGFLAQLQQIHSEQWQNMALYLEDSELSEIHPEVLKRLLSSREVMNTSWETGKGTLLILARKDRQVFEGLVKGMANANDVESWHVLALKFLIEKYESDFPNLFQDESFRLLYGRLLRKVYLRYIPWYHRLLIYLNIKIFQDDAFHQAKSHIMSEQSLLAGRNLKKKEAERQKQIVERKEKLSKAQDLGAIMRINEKIDSCFRNGELPTIAALASSGESDKVAVTDFLKRNSFQMIPLEGNQDSIVLYPLDQNWRVRSAKLLRVLDSWKSKQANDPDANRKLLFYPNLQRIRRLLLDKGVAGRKKGANDIDPYERFEKELKKHKAKEAEDTLEI